MLDPLLNYFRGRAVTIPPMDGALRPNTALDDAEIVREANAADNLVAGDDVLFSSGPALMSLDGRIRTRFDSDITALAAHDGRFAVGLESGVIDLDGRRIQGFRCPVALAFGGADALYVCNGSDSCAPSGWTGDLMSRNARGSVWRVDLRTDERQCLAEGLAFPFGIVVEGDRLIVSESWRHKLIGIPITGGKPVTLAGNLPGYPARISRTSNGFFLCIFAPRNRLIEFVLLEQQYRDAMMREIDSAYWIAPSLSASRSFLEPLQNGAVKTMGIHKPWSPTRSYGLVVKLDGALRPIDSYHSRANGTRHGITSAIEVDGRILASCKGGNAILGLAP